MPTDAEEEATEGASDPDDGPAGQSGEGEALRRQQLFVGTAVASLSGMAVVVAGLQQFPGVTPVVPFGVGMVTTAATFAVVYASIFGE
ncbi:MAG: hypothetical protein V5A28_15525 [Haloarculaceae archaeon]